MLARKIPTPSQYTSKRPLVVAPNARRGKGETDSMTTPIKAYALVNAILLRLHMQAS